MKKVNVLIIDDHSVVAEGVKAVLQQRSNLIVAGQAKDGFEGITIAKSSKPDLIITDLRMPQMTGIESVQQIHAFLPGVRAIILSGSFSIPSVRQALQAGITGLVDKETAAQDLPEAVDCVLSGKEFFSLNIRHLIASDMQQMLRGYKLTTQTGLTGDEVDMVRMLTEGRSVVQIADKVKKSPKTIDAKRRRIMMKLGFESLANLTKYAIRQGITSLE